MPNPFLNRFHYGNEARAQELVGRLTNPRIQHMYLWGEHGIGKTTFTQYFLRCFLQRLNVEAKLGFTPVILHYEFDEGGDTTTYLYRRESGECEDSEKIKKLKVFLKPIGVKGPEAKGERDIARDVAQAVIDQLQGEHTTPVATFEELLEVETPNFDLLKVKLHRLAPDVQIIVVLDNYQYLGANRDTLEVIDKFCHVFAVRLHPQRVFPLVIGRRRAIDLKDVIRRKPFGGAIGVGSAAMCLGRMTEHDASRFMVLENHEKPLMEGSWEPTDEELSVLGFMRTNHQLVRRFTLCQAGLIPGFINAVCQSLFDEMSLPGKLSELADEKANGQESSPQSGRCAIRAPRERYKCATLCYDSEALICLYRNSSKRADELLFDTFDVIWGRYIDHRGVVDKGQEEQRALKAVAAGRPSDKMAKNPGLRALLASELVVDEGGEFRIPWLLQRHIAFEREPPKPQADIREEARQAKDFLKELRDRLVSCRGFQSSYPQSEIILGGINELLSDLESNLEGLEKAEPKASTHLQISPLKEDVDIYRLNLAHAKNNAQTWWHEFRATALEETRGLMKKAQHAKPEKGQLEKTTEGLQQVEKFLVASADIIDAAERQSSIADDLVAAVESLQSASLVGKD